MKRSYFYVPFNIRGAIVVAADTKEEAIELVANMRGAELYPYVYDKAKPEILEDEVEEGGK